MMRLRKYLFLQFHNLYRWSLLLPQPSDASDFLTSDHSHLLWILWSLYCQESDIAFSDDVLHRPKRTLIPLSWIRNLLLNPINRRAVLWYHLLRIKIPLVAIDKFQEPLAWAWIRTHSCNPVHHVNNGYIRLRPCGPQVRQIGWKPTPAWLYKRFAHHRLQPTRITRRRRPKKREEQRNPKSKLLMSLVNHTVSTMVPVTTISLLKWLRNLTFPSCNLILC